QDAAVDHVEMTVGKVQLLGVHLDKVHLDAQGFGAGMGIAQDRRANVDGIELRLRVVLGPGQGGVAHGAAEVKDALGLEFRMVLLQPLGGRGADVVVQRAHAAHGVNVHGAVVDGTGGHVIGAELGVVATGHAVDVNGGVVVGSLQVGVQRQAAEGGLGAGFASRFHQFRQLAFYRDLHRV